MAFNFEIFLKIYIFILINIKEYIFIIYYITFIMKKEIKENEDENILKNLII